MRVGVVAPGELGRPTGGYVYDRELVRTLRGGGDEVDVITLPHRGLGANLLDNLRRSVHEQLRSLEADVIVQDALCHPSLLIHNVRTATPVVGLIHLPVRSDPEGDRLRAAIERVYLSGLDGIVYPSDATRRVVRSVAIPPNELVATPGGDRLGEPPPRDWIVERTRRGPLRLLTLGTVESRKGHDTVVEALTRLDGTDFELRIVGRTDAEPAFVARLRDQIADHHLPIEVTGAVDDESVRRALEWAHLLVLPSRYESFGIAYLEALGFGVVPIGADVGAAPTVIGDAGVLVPPDDPQVLAEELDRLDDDRRELERLALASRSRFERFPTWEESTARLRSFLSVIAENSG